MIHSERTSILMRSMGILALIAVMGTGAYADFTFSNPTKVQSINSAASDQTPQISRDGLELYFSSDRDGNDDIWVAQRLSTDDPWSDPVKLDAAVNTAGPETTPSLSADGLELYFANGYNDLWVTKRANRDAAWGVREKLPKPVNSSSAEECPSISADGLELYFLSERGSDSSRSDIYVTTRPTKDAAWGEPERLRYTVNSNQFESCPFISADGLMLFCCKGMSGAHIWYSQRATVNDPWDHMTFFSAVNSGKNTWRGFGNSDMYLSFADNDPTFYFARGSWVWADDFDIWQVKPIGPVLDLNGDTVIDKMDLAELQSNLGNTDNTLYDIAPFPFGDGVATEQDVTILNDYLNANPLAENPYPINEDTDVPNSTLLTWEPNELIQLYDVYLGTDYDAVRNARPGDSYTSLRGHQELLYHGRQESNSYDPGELAFYKTYYWRVDAVSIAESESTRKGSVWQFTTGGIITDHYPADQSTDVVGWPAILSWVPGISIVWCDVYIGDDLNAVDQATPEHTDIYRGRYLADEPSFTTSILNPQTPYYWRIDGVDGADPGDVWRGIVRQFTTSPFIASYYPENYATNVSRSVILSWEPNGSGLFFDVYFGEDRSNVADATPESVGIYQGQQAPEETAFSPGKLKSKTPYFWRIDIVDSDTQQILRKGSLWSFTTPKSR
jgi:hypothetical protein